MCWAIEFLLALTPEFRRRPNQFKVQEFCQRHGNKMSCAKFIIKQLESNFLENPDHGAIVEFCNRGALLLLSFEPSWFLMFRNFEQRQSSGSFSHHSELQKLWNKSCVESFKFTSKLQSRYCYCCIKIVAVPHQPENGLKNTQNYGHSLSWLNMLN